MIFTYLQPALSVLILNNQEGPFSLFPHYFCVLASNITRDAVRCRKTSFFVVIQISESLTRMF